MGSPLSVCPGMESEDIGGYEKSNYWGGWGQIIGGDVYPPSPPGWAAMTDDRGPRTDSRYRKKDNIRAVKHTGLIGQHDVVSISVSRRLF